MPARIFIVDDEPAIADAIQYALETEGLTVKRAGAENEAAEDAEVEDAKAKGLTVGNPTNACP